MLKKVAIIFVVIMFLIIGCNASESLAWPAIVKISHSATATIRPINTTKPTETLIPTSTLTSTPTITPTAIGGSYPLIAYSIHNPLSHQNFLKINDLQQGKTLAMIPWNFPAERQQLYQLIHPIVFSEDGKLLVYAVGLTMETEIRIYHLDSGENEQGPVLGETEELVDLTISPDNNWLAFYFMDSEIRKPYLWLYHRPSQTKKYVGAGVTDGVWTDDNQLIYQQYFSNHYEIDPKSLSTESIMLPKRSKLLGNIFSNWGIRYYPNLNAALLYGVSKQDKSRYLVLISLETKEETVLAHLSADVDILQRQNNNILVSPDGNYFLIEDSYQTWDEKGKYTGTVHNAYLVHKDDLPITGNEEPLLDLIALEWAPDSSALLAYQPAGGFDPELVIIDVDKQKSQVISPFISHEKDLYSVPIIDDGVGVSVYWPSEPLTFDIPNYQPPTPTATSTLEADVTQSPTAVPLQPMYTILDNPITALTPDITQFQEEGWDYNKALLIDNKIVVEGTGSWDGHLNYPLYGIDANEGVLLKFKAFQNTRGHITLNRGEWQKTTFREWGINVPVITPKITRGTKYEQTEIINKIISPPETWYYLFLGVDANNELIQLIWNAETPLNYQLSFHNYNNDYENSYFFDIRSDTGKIIIDEVVFYQFEGYKE